MRTKIISISVVLAGGFLLMGACCVKVADEVAENVVQPINVPIQILKQSQADLELVNARTYEDGERVSDDVQVPFIATSNSAGFDQLEGVTVGCEDKLVFKKIHRMAATEQVMSDVLNTLLAQKESTVSGLYNALWQSQLVIEKVQSSDGVTTEVWLKGEVVSSGACDYPRIKAQIEQSVVRFRPKFKVLLNGTEKEWRCLGNQSEDCE